MTGVVRVAGLKDARRPSSGKTCLGGGEGKRSMKASIISGSIGNDVVVEAKFKLAAQLALSDPDCDKYN